VTYTGKNKFEFKEGETILLQAYCPDTNNRDRIIATTYVTKHSMELN